MIKYIIVLLLCCPGAYGQNVNIKGSVLSGRSPVPDAIVTITDSGKVINLITSITGLFQLSKYRVLSDTLQFTISGAGYFSLLTIITNKAQLQDLRFNLVKDSVRRLETVTVTGADVSAHANKIIYKIRSKDYLVNAKTNIALQALPNVSVTGEGAIVDGRKKAIIFIDGVESGIDDLKRLDVKDVDKIEVISNPSASYGTDLLGSVIQVITKKKIETFIKGELEVYKGVRLGAFGIVPTLSFKNKRITFRSYYGYNTNNQLIESDLLREEANSQFSQHSLRKVKGWQDYSSSRMRIILNPRSGLNFSGNMFRYQFTGALTGYYSNNADPKSAFTVDDTEKLSKWSISSIYNYSFTNHSQLLVKGKYFNYKNRNLSLYAGSGGERYDNDIYSDTREISGEMVFEEKQAKWLGLPLEYTAGYKGIYRKFYFQAGSFNLDQYINSAYLNTDIRITPRFSIFTSLTAELTRNKTQDRQQQYVFLLPAFSGLFKINQTTLLRADYSRKTTRPSANYLNPAPIFFSPAYRLLGNSNLVPQLRDLVEVSLQKNLKDAASLTFKLYAELNKDAIVETITKESGVTTNTYVNAGRAGIYGGYIGFTSKLFKKLALNLNTGVSYNDYYSGSPYSLAGSNKGFSFNSGFNLGALVKQVVSLNLNGSYNSPGYSLLYMQINRPRFSFDAESAVLKKKLNIRLSYNDILGLGTRSESEINYNGFYQHLQTDNKTTNFTITLIYRIGKVFSDRFSNPVINNDDIKLK